MNDAVAAAVADPPTFDALALSPDVKSAIDAIGYTTPTPVQLAVFEPAIRGKNIVVQARTGTGKTAAFGLPLVDQIIKRGTPRVQALILTPTRELALQVARELERIAKNRGTKIAVIYGGASMNKQVEALEAGAQLVVGTPGRVLDHLNRKTLDPSGIRALVLDEADEMLSMGFARELHAILDTLPKERQTLLFSATIPPDIQRLAETRLKDPEFITLSGDHIGALEITHYVYFTGSADKRAELVRIIEVENPESAIIFCNTKDETERLAEALQNKGFDSAWLNGDLEQKEREIVMQKTREGKLRFLVATDVAARGIDISHLTHVINFDFPEAPENYVHRTGRTGRAGKIGTAIALVAPKDVGNLYLVRLAYKIRPIEKRLPSAQEMKTRAETDIVGVFAQAFAQRDVHPEDLALARRLLTHDDGEKIVAGLIRDHLGARPREESARLASEQRRAARPAPAAFAEAAPDTRPGRPRPPADAPRSMRETVPAPLSIDAVRTKREGRPRDDRDRKRGRDTEPPSPPGFTIEEEAKPSSSMAGPVTGQARIFVNVGKRDGATVDEIARLLRDGAGVGASDIYLRDRNAFISVKPEDLERAIAALSGQTVGGRTIIAEPARPK